MDNYIDIRLEPDDEMKQNVLLNKVYTKFHKALCDLSTKHVGVSFPECNVVLGKLMRIHGEFSILQDLQGLNWLGGLSGYCEVSEILSVPENCVSFRTVSRIRPIKSNSKLKRKIKEKNLSIEEIKEYKAKMFAGGLSEPYVEIESASNGQSYRRYFLMGELRSEPLTGTFDQFGLSKNATIPWF